MNKKIAWSLVVIVAAAVGLVSALRGDKYVPRTEELTFERNVDSDEGHALVAANLVATSGVSLTDVYTPVTKKFTPERTSRYGADRTEPDGEGLTVNFVRKDGGKTETKTFRLKGWEFFEQTTRPVRRKEVEDAEPRFAESIEAFIAPVTIKRAFGIALDTTEGVTPQLAKRVKEVIDNTRAIQIGGDTKNIVVLNLYNITQSPYQGGRERPNPSSKEELKISLEWLLKERKAEAQSSVLRGMVAILLEMSEYKDSRPRLDVFTDGLENLSELSVYKHPEYLSDEAGWSHLDQIANLASLKLAGLEVHLHPLPANSASHATMMERGLAYLADRLAKAGASVKIEPL